MKNETQANVPFQIQHLIDSMLNSKDNVYLRGNYRARLEYIKEQIDVSIKKYDTEVIFTNSSKKKS